MNIYVGNMNFNFKDEDLNNLFTPYGNVSSAKIIIDRESGRSKGFGFVEMEKDEEALKAIESLHQTEVMGRKLVVNQARPQEKKPGGGFGSGNRYGGRDAGGGEGRN
jgi:RNA recognition motif-containing protein